MPAGAYASSALFATVTDLVTLAPGDYTVEMFDSYGDGWNGGNLGIFDLDGDAVANGTLATGSTGSFPFSVDCLEDTAPVVIDTGLPSCDITVELQTYTWANEIGWELADGSGALAASVTPGPLVNFTLYTTVVQNVLPGQISFTMIDSYGDGWHNGFYTLYDSNGNVIGTNTLLDPPGDVQTDTWTFDCAVDSGLAIDTFDTGLSPDTGSTTSPIISFAADIEPLLGSCTGCHVNGSSAGLNWAAGASALIGVPSSQAPWNLVEPGNHLQSYWYHKVNGSHTAPQVGGSLSQMPLGGAPLPTSSINAIRAWINAGALP